MKKILSVLLVIVFANAFTQSTQNLDVKNGFKHFKLGSSPSQINNLVPQEQQFSQNPNVKAYDYVGTDIQYISNVKIDNIVLHFFKNKLFMIAINFGDLYTNSDFTYVDYKNILTWLEQAYGKKWFSPTNDDGTIVNGAIWDGKKVRLELFRTDFSKSNTNPKDYGYIGGYISVFDKNLNKQMYADDF